MSRWIEKFQASVRGSEWDRLQRAIRDCSVEISDTPVSTDEFARLQKVIGFIDGVLDGVEPELLPLNFFDPLQMHIHYCANRVEAFGRSGSIDEVMQANAHADDLLSLVRPYLVLDGSAGNAFRKAAVGYARAFEQLSAKSTQSFNESIRDILLTKDRVKKAGQRIEQIVERLDGEENRLFGEEGVLSHAEAKALDAEEKYRDINHLHQIIFFGADGSDSINAQVEAASLIIAQKSQEAIALVGNADQPVKRILEFEQLLLGDPGRPEIESVSRFVENKKEQLLEFENEQKAKTNELIKKIESLIPGATSAGLATAYREMRESFDGPIRAASRIFYGTIGVLILGSILLCIQKVYWFGIEFIELPDWQASLRSIAYKLPFYAAAVWLAYYASKRRSEFQRLQQEYAHKEALAKSYDSFKRQIEVLGDKDDVLMAMLLEKAIGAIAHNASQTLDGKHGDKAPAHDALEKVLSNLSGIRDIFK